MAMAPGDWVTTCSSGIWQVYRLLPVRQEMRFSLGERRKKSKRVIVFARRIVNANWRRAFQTACCEQSLVTPLSKEDRKRLDLVLKSDEGLRAAFDRYQPEPAPLIVNLTMGQVDRTTLKAFCRDLLGPAMAGGVSMEDVLRLLEAANLMQYVQKYPTRARLQMVCQDHEVRDGEFVFRECRVLDF